MPRTESVYLLSVYLLGFYGIRASILFIIHLLK
jgi:hypothetical protein